MTNGNSSVSVNYLFVDESTGKSKTKMLKSIKKINEKALAGEKSKNTKCRTKTMVTVPKSHNSDEKNWDVLWFMFLTKGVGINHIMQCLFVNSYGK